MHGALILFHLVLLLIILKRWEQRIWVKPGAVTTRLQTGLTASVSVLGTVGTLLPHAEWRRLMTKAAVVHCPPAQAHTAHRAPSGSPPPAVVDVVARRYRDLARPRLGSRRGTQATYPPLLFYGHRCSAPAMPAGTVQHFPGTSHLGAGR